MTVVWLALCRRWQSVCYYWINIQQSDYFYSDLSKLSEPVRNHTVSCKELLFSTLPLVIALSDISVQHVESRLIVYHLGVLAYLLAHDQFWYTVYVFVSCPAELIII